MSNELKQLLEWARDFVPQEEMEDRIIDAAFKTISGSHVFATREHVAEEWRRLRG